MGIPAHLQNHELFSGKSSFGLMSGEAPRYPGTIEPSHENLVRTLKGMGLRHQETHGKYGGPERSVIIYGPSREQMQHLGKMFGQESVVHSQGGQHELHYTHGPDAGKSHFVAPGHQTPTEFFSEPPDDYYTHLPGHGYFRINFDFSQPPAEKDAIKTGLNKNEDLRGPAQHYHAYPWHDSHTSHHRVPDPQSPVPGLRKSADTDYVKWTGLHGTTGNPQNELRHYDLANKLPEIENLVKAYGYKTYYGGGAYGKADLGSRNYDTGHLLIHDPSGGSYQDETYNRAWRQLHELSHALTQPEVNRIYGEGRRCGGLGKLSLNEAQRALHWEYLAAHKQRELGEKIGVRVPDEVFHRELNTLMADGLHRLVTGGYQDPALHGFKPHSHSISADAAFDVLRAAAQEKGLRGLHDRLQKSAVIYSQQGKNMADNTKSFSQQEALEFLKSETRKKVQALAAEFQELRKRETQKSLIPAHRHAPGTTVSGGIEDVAAGKLETPFEKKTPPGISEETMHKLKAQYGGDKEKAYATAWKIHNEKQAKKAEKPETSEEETSSPERSSHEETAAELEKQVPGLSDAPGVNPPGTTVMARSELCKECGAGHALDKGCGPAVGKAELVDGKGKKKTTSEHPDSVLPGDRKSQVVNKPGAGNGVGSGGTIKKGKSLKDLHKTALSATKKAEPPMAKPPSGKNMATHVPVSAPKAPAAIKPSAAMKGEDAGSLGGFQSPGYGETVAKDVTKVVVPNKGKPQLPKVPKAKRDYDVKVTSSQVEYTKKTELGKADIVAGKMPKDMKALASAHASSAPRTTLPAAAAKPMPTSTEQAQRAQNFQAAAAGAFTPKAPVTSGLDLDIKPKLASPKQQSLASTPAQAKKPGIFGRLMGKK